MLRHMLMTGVLVFDGFKAQFRPHGALDKPGAPVQVSLETVAQIARWQSQIDGKTAYTNRATPGWATARH